jgi:cell fate (sporulation/competence/biofilm development) regulator YmcA (YheA/YmcA/DUF963 family)
MQKITRSVVGPKNLMYLGEFQQAENPSEYADVIAAMGLSLDEVNEALKKAKKLIYTASLDTTVDSIVADLKKALLAGGYDEAEAVAMSEARRDKLSKGLPAGLTIYKNEDGTQKISKRGVHNKKDAAPEVPATPTA